MVVAEYADDSISASDRRKVRPGYARTSGLIRPRADDHAPAKVQPTSRR
jgi:hypothetical protein